MRKPGIPSRFSSGIKKCRRPSRYQVGTKQNRGRVGAESQPELWDAANIIFAESIWWSKRFITPTSLWTHNCRIHQAMSEIPSPKDHNLLFSAKTAVPQPWNVYWQFVNTGEHVRRANELRRNIFSSKTAGVGELTQKESTKYRGMHWIECFVVKNDVCLARSGEFVVNIQ